MQTMCKRRSSTAMKAISHTSMKRGGYQIRKLEVSEPPSRYKISEMLPPNPLWGPCCLYGVQKDESATNVFISRKHHLDIQPAPDAEKKAFTWRAWENIVKFRSSIQRSPLERGLVGFDSSWENELGSRSVGGFVFFLQRHASVVEEQKANDPDYLICRSSVSRVI